MTRPLSDLRGPVRALFSDVDGTMTTGDRIEARVDQRQRLVVRTVGEGALLDHGTGSVGGGVHRDLRQRAVDVPRPALGVLTTHTCEPQTRCVVGERRLLTAGVRGRGRVPA